MSCWLHGKPGTGKTATALWTLRKLENETGIKGVYVNCWENPTFFSVLECMAKQLRVLGAKKLSTSLKLERLKRHPSNERMILVLDAISFSLPPPLPFQIINSLLYDIP